ncbi:MAG: glycosyltransferase [Deltaproteobacteria bacterium]|nr:glycosyltransferase [Deltaproteobacteria bacterium]
MTNPRARRPVLFVLPTLGGGAARVVITLLRHLDRTRFEPHLVVFYTFYGFWFRSEVPEDVVMHVLEAKRARNAMPKLVHLLWRVRPAVVVATQGYINFLLLLARPVLPKCALVIREVIGERYMEHNRYRDLLYRWYLRLVRGADRIVTQTQAVAEQLTAAITPRPGQVECIHNPVDAERLATAAARATSPFTGPGPHVLAMGRLTYQKGFDLLLEALARVRAAGVPARLTIVGVGELEADLGARAATLGVAGAVDLVGFQEEPERFFAHADVFVLSSRYEGMPNVVLEALACGLPIVAFDCPHGVREIVRDGVNGRLLPPEDLGALTAALLDLLRDQPARARLRAAAAASIRSFTAPVVSARWNAIFAELTGA